MGDRNTVGRMARPELGLYYTGGGWGEEVGCWMLAGSRSDAQAGRKRTHQIAEYTGLEQEEVELHLVQISFLQPQ